MSYWTQRSKNFKNLNSYGLSTNQSSKDSGKEEFHELELGLVLDIVLDENHPIFSTQSNVSYTIDADRWPADFEGKKPSPTDKDLSWIGKALVRLTNTEKTTKKDNLAWVYPMENTPSEYPLLNELVVVARYDDKLFYTKKLNISNWPDNNIDFGMEPSLAGDNNIELYTNTPVPYSGPLSVTKYQGGPNYQGVAGRYFVANNKIRTIKRFEGDFLIESRFGQTIHLTSYDNNRSNDIGDPKNVDYVNGGNPMILIRNRQRPLVKSGTKLQPNKKLPPIIGTDQEKNVGGYLEENINHDGTSVYITSGLTISQWVTTCYKQMFGNGEEVPGFNGTTSFKYPVLNGDQVVLNTDRLIFSSRYGETFHYSKKRYGIVTDSEYTLDAHQQIVLTTNTKTVINSPAIYLGQYDATGEPALLGQSTVNLLYNLIEWLIAHTHWYEHSHTNAGKESPSQTQTSPQIQSLISIQNSLQTLLSRRVFITGGGLEPGKNGGTITDGTPPLIINTSTGDGVPGGWKGSNYRKS